MLQKIKKLFFTYRNGAVADTLRRYGMPHKLIFGLQVPQIAAIARELEFSSDDERLAMARTLWADREVRESRLLACYLFIPELTEHDSAEALALDTRTQEESDMLAFRLLKRIAEPHALLSRLEALEAPEAQRTATSLRRHLE